MRRAALLLLALGCGSTQTRQESVTVIAAPASHECPEGTVFNGVTCAELLSHAGSIDASAPVVHPAVDQPLLVDEARDLRKFSKFPRGAALLVAELQALESLKNATATSSPDYPQVVRRLAEDYSEHSYASAATGDRKATAESRKKAIAAYSMLTQNHSSMSAIDEVLYYLAYAYELDGDLAHARKTYFELISRHPQSKYIPYAYYAFGEAFHEEAKSDPTKYALATQAYLETLKFATSNIQPWALLRTGQTYDAVGDHVRAQQMWAKLKRDFPQSPAASQAP